jgi:hypothetical protein
VPSSRQRNIGARRPNRTPFSGKQPQGAAAVAIALDGMLPKLG